MPPREIPLENLDLSEFIRPGDGIVWGQTAAEPVLLTRALVAQRHSIGPVSAFIGATWSDVANPAYTDAIRFYSYCAAAANRSLAAAGKLEVVRSHYSKLAEEFRSGRLPGDVVMLQVAPDLQGTGASLSLANEYLIPALERARVVIVEANEAAPWTDGEYLLPLDRIDVIVRSSRALPSPPSSPVAPSILQVAHNIASLIDDGDVLQFGIGSLPEAVLSQLHDRRNLGIHSGAFLDAAADLCERGVVTNSTKKHDAGVSVAGVVMAGERGCRHVHRNPSVRLRSVEYTHAASVLSRIAGLVAINAALEVDLAGQVNSEYAGDAYVGAVGGAPDFLRGAMLAPNGKSIVGLPATVRKEGRLASRIVAGLCGPVSTEGRDVGFVVTEFGVADLRGQSPRERAKRLIQVAAPEFREDLAREISP